ncbi:ABC transporter substrate-binding protein [Herbiconiux daphne]|uniref:Extracellular solute-binding protein n=1 Tax=Herbiconiux daphne TaxID=2970914 RepID=A0ABT2H791_9MICO|nr:extracellular solute-binding protein [Herbiconiux daphne]MCS5735743.1 extracellular solute-binding protein [Herbiconiux daphne]
MSTSQQRRIAVGLSLFTASALALSACSGGTTPPPSDGPVEVPGATAEGNAFMNELYDSALEAGATDVVIYGPGPSTSKPLYDAFTARFPGITVVPQDAPDSQAITKLQAEAEAGSRIADLFMSGTGAVVQAAKVPDVCTATDIQTAPADWQVETIADGLVLPYSLRYMTLIYNTDNVTAEEAPRTWDDLLDPRWKGKLVMGDPTIAGGVRYVLTGLLVPETADTWGTDYLDKLAAQDIVYGTAEAAVPADVASGRGDVGVAVFSGYATSQKAKGAPIEIVFPMDDGGSYIIDSSICSVQDAPHKDAALLFSNWLFSSEGQTAIAELDDAYGTVPGAPGPEGAPSFDQLKYLPRANPTPGFNEPYFAEINEAFAK